METGSIFALGGAFAFVVGAWNQLKLFGDKLTRLAVVRSDLGPELSSTFIGYARRHGRVFAMGDATYQASLEYVNMSDNYVSIPYQTYEQPIVVRMHSRWFLVQPKKTKEDTVSGLIVYTVRSRVPVWDKLLEDLCAYKNSLATYDSADREKDAFIPKRFCVTRVFGSAQDVPLVSPSVSSSSTGSRAMTNAVVSFREGSARIIGPITYNQISQRSQVDESPFAVRPYSDEILAFLDVVGHWLGHKQWFKERGLSWRKGVMFHSDPGNGKSTLAECIGRYFDLPVFVPGLSSMTNKDFHSVWENAERSSPCIFLMEDWDRVFRGNENIGCANGRGVTLDTVLNCISGVQHEGGVLVILTVNDITAVDPALGIPDKDGGTTRPGRIDHILHVAGPDAIIRDKMARTILKGQPEDDIETAVAAGEDMSYTKFSDYCQNLALEFYNKMAASIDTAEPARLRYQRVHQRANRVLPEFFGYERASQWKDPPRQDQTGDHPTNADHQNTNRATMRGGLFQRAEHRAV